MQRVTTPPDPTPDQPGPRPAPDALTAVSFLLLAALAALLLWPLLAGGAATSPYMIGGLLLARLGVQLLRARRDPRLRRPVSWALDLLIIALIFNVASRQPA